MPLGSKVSSTFVPGIKEALPFSMLSSPGAWSDTRNAAAREPFEEKAPRLEAVAMDMNTGFAHVVQEHLPHVALVFDHYHISALINRAIDDLRREQQAQLDEKEQKTLKGSRFLLLKNYENLDQDKQSRLQNLLQANSPLLTMYTMKEQFRDFWEKPSIIEAMVFLDAWCTDAENSGIKQLKYERFP